MTLFDRAKYSQGGGALVTQSEPKKRKKGIRCGKRRKDGQICDHLILGEDDLAVVCPDQKCRQPHNIFELLRRLIKEGRLSLEQIISELSHQKKEENQMEMNNLKVFIYVEKEWTPTPISFLPGKKEYVVYEVTSADFGIPGFSKHAIYHANVPKQVINAGDDPWLAIRFVIETKEKWEKAGAAVVYSVPFTEKDFRR